MILERVHLNASSALESEAYQCPLAIVRSMEENFPVSDFFSWNGLLSLWNPAEPQDVVLCGFKFCCWKNHCAFSSTSSFYLVGWSSAYDCLAFSKDRNMLQHWKVSADTILFLLKCLLQHKVKNPLIKLVGKFHTYHSNCRKSNMERVWLAAGVYFQKKMWTLPTEILFKKLEAVESWADETVVHHSKTLHPCLILIIAIYNLLCAWAFFFSFIVRVQQLLNLKTFKAKYFR